MCGGGIDCDVVCGVRVHRTLSRSGGGEFKKTSQG